MKTTLTLLFVFAALPAWAEDYACLIEPMQTLKLAASVTGVVESVKVDRGDRVTKGQLLAQLDSAVEAANLQIAQLRSTNDTEIASGQAKVEFLSRKASRNEKLRNSTDFVSQTQLEETASDAKVAVAQLHQAQLNFGQAKLEAARAEGQLKQRQILSPVDGVVTERTLGQSEYLNDQAHILTLAQMNPLRIEAFLPISVYGHIKIGDMADILPEDPVGGLYQAKVTVVDRVFDAASSTIGVRLELPNPDLALPAGIHCHVRFRPAS